MGLVFHKRPLADKSLIIIYSYVSEIHAYDNTAFNSGSGAHEMEERRDRDSKVEVERLGYEMYNGKHENR